MAKWGVGVHGRFWTHKRADAAHRSATADPGHDRSCGGLRQTAAPRCKGRTAAQCGQHVADYHRSLWRFIGEFFDNTICWDNKALRTLGPLLTRPGVLTREFMAGRRVHYVQPLRLFLFTSAVCLTLLFHHQNQVRVVTGSHGKEKNKHHADTTPAPSPDATPGGSAAPSPEASGDHGGDQKLEADTKAIVEQAGRDALAGKDTSTVGDQIGQDVKARVAAAGGVERFGQTISNDVQQHLSWVALVILPIFALLLRTMYWRQENYYFEHLIFSLHYHTFLLLFWTVLTGLGVIEGTTFLLRWLTSFNTLAMLVVPGGYLYLALREVYGGSARRTAAKVLFIGAVHVAALLLGVTLVGAMAVFRVPK